MPDSLKRAPFIKSRAEAALASVGAVGPPTDLYAIAKAYRITVQQGPLPEGVAGEYDQIANTITLGPRDRWPLAHELGHALLEHGDARCYEGPVASDMPMDEMDVGVPFEPEANRFARYLIVPREWLKDAHDQGLKPPEMAERFAVSEEVIWRALMDYRLV
jgi:hypothetical protein